MALFKILKGQEKNLPANKTEGWAYVTTDEGNMYVDVSASKRVRIGAHADKADVATKAEGDTESIRAKYLAKLKQVTSNGTTFTFRGETGDGTDAADLITIPLAGDKAGLISNTAQTIKGNKTFANGISFPTIGTWPTPANETYPIKSQGLSWSGSSDNAAIFYEVQASDKGMLVIESGDDTNAGLEIRNAASKKKVTIIDGLVTGAFKGNLTGTASHATSDVNGKNITSYIASVLAQSDNRTIRVTTGDGTTNDVKLYFAASSSFGGDANSALTVGQGNNPDTAFDANNIIVARSKKTFYSTNTDKMTNRPNGTRWGYLNVGSYDNSGTYMYQTFINGDNANMFIRIKYNNTWKAWKTIAFTDGTIENANYADKAKGDSTSIRTTYIHKIKQVTSNGTTFALRGEYGDGSDANDLITIPNASTTLAGLITNAAQTIAGAKTFSGGVTVSNSSGFNYSGIETGSGDSTRPIWFAHSSKNGTPVVNASKFTYNPGTDTMVVGKIKLNGLDIAQNYLTSVEKSGTISVKTKTGDGTEKTFTLEFLPLAGGTMVGNIAFSKDNIIQWARNTDFAKIGFKNDSDGDTDSYMYFHTGDNGNEYFKFRITSGSTITDVLNIKNGAATFNGTVTATKFIGALQGTADYANKAQGDSTTIRSTYIASIKQVTSNGTTFTFRGYAGDGSEKNNLITIPVATTNVAGLITNTAQTIAGTKTLQGNIIIKPGALSNHQEGLRICNADNGWTSLILGGTATSGTSASSWSLHTNGGNFYLTHNGSSSSSTGILQSDTNGNWQIKNKLGVNGQNIGYQFYVNGSSYLNGTVEVQGITTHHSNIQLDNTVRIRRNGRSVSWNQANTCAMMTMDTAEGWSPFIAQKVTNGWWTIGQYNTSGFANDWLFGYLTDGNVSGVSGAQNTLSTTVRLINVGGDRMFVTSANRTQHGSNVNPVYVSNTGKVIACTYELKSTVEGGSANRLPYYSTANKISPTTHYANTTQIGINENNIAKIGSYSLYVNGPTFIQSSNANSTTHGLIVNNGLINVTNYGYTLKIGNANNAYTHFETSCSQFYFNKQIVVNGHLFPYANNSNYNGTSSNYWNRTYSQWIVANAAGSSTDGGITLYGNRDTNYGIFFRSTGNMGTHGSVTADWATYFTMSNTAGRGWIFRNTGAGNVASISAQGHMTVNGSIGINGTNVGYKLYVNGGESWVHGKLWTGDVVPESNNSKVCGDGNYYWSSMSTRWLHANRGGSSTDGGITLYTTSDTYGIMFRGTSNMGTHGWVTSDWATYFTMNDQNNRGWIFRRHNSKNVFSIDTNGFIWADGSLRANAVGKNGFMTFPRGGQYRTTTSSITGYLRIQLPVYRCNTMLKFIVDIYNYSENTSVSYAISGYNYQDGVWHNCTAECLSHHGQDKQNLTVAFGEMNSKSAVMIGSSSTTWSYPQVQIRDIIVGYSNFDYKYWNNADWGIDFSTSPIGNVSRSFSGTDNIRVSRGQFDQLVVINDASNTSYDALAYFRNHSNSDWTMIIDKNNAYDYGLDIRTSTNATYGLRTNGQLIVNSTCGSYREGIRLRGADGTWNTIILGATAESGTNANAWSIHRKNDNNFCISRNSSDGLNGLVMTSTGMGLGTTAPGYRLHVNGKGCFENRIYAHEWIEFNGDRGLYWPSGGYHFYPCTNTSYGSFGLRGSRGGYHGLTIGYDNNYMTVMDSGVHKGLYQASQGMWIFYYNRDSQRVGLRTSSLSSYAVTCEGDFYCRNGWLRTNGATGWYNESYGGGIYMTDSTWVRTYNNKNFYCSAVIGAGNRIFAGWDSGVSGSVSCNNWFRSSGQSGWYNNSYGGGIYMTDSTYVRVYGNKRFYSSGRYLSGKPVASSWLDGQRYDNAAYNIESSTDNGSYWPWMRHTNTNTGKWFSFGTLGTSFYWIGSSTSRTSNGYDYGMSFNVANGYLQGCTRVYAAVWNDYAEYRETKENIEPGRVVIETGFGNLKLSTERLQPGGNVVSDTYGFAIGETEKAKTPIAVSGRALVYTYEDKNIYQPGDAVCTGPNGTISKMTREEIMLYPERIVGTVSEIPDYKVWGEEDVPVNGRIWIKVK